MRSPRVNTLIRYGFNVDKNSLCWDMFNFSNKSCSILSFHSLIEVLNLEIQNYSMHKLLMLLEYLSYMLYMPNKYFNPNFWIFLCLKKFSLFCHIIPNTYFIVIFSQKLLLMVFQSSKLSHFLQLFSLLNVNAFCNRISFLKY